MRASAIALLALLCISVFVYIPEDATAAAPTITNYGASYRIDAGGILCTWLTYTSDNNDTPSYVRTTRTSPAAIKNMLKNDTADTDFRDGVQYHYEWQYYDVVATLGTLILRVKAANFSEVTQSVNYCSVPYPYFKNESVIPVSNEAGEYSFYAEYWHLFDWAPYDVNYLQVAVDGIFHNMSWNGTGDGLFFNGEYCHFEMTLEDGAHTYQFYCCDDYYGTFGNWTSGEHWFIVGGSSGAIQLSAGPIILLLIISVIVGYALFKAVG